MSKKFLLMVAVVMVMQACDLKYIGGKRLTDQNGQINLVEIRTKKSTENIKSTDKTDENKQDKNLESKKTEEKTSPRVVKLRAINQWNVRGRVSIVTGDDGWSGSIRWKQVDSHYDIRIVGPLGQGAMWLQGSPGFVELRSSKNKESVTATDAESLLYRQMGWKIPISGLRYWVLGLFGPGKTEEIKYNKQGLPSEFVQAGWTIRLLRYREVAGQQIPVKIFLNNDRFRVKMIIKLWKLES